MIDDIEEEYAPKVINKGKTCDLNMQRQYKRRVNHCTIRKLFRIHDFTKQGDHGAQDRSLVYVEFQGGLFEALKQNMVKILKKNHSVRKQTILKLKLLENVRLKKDFVWTCVGDPSHDLKVKVYNTTCALDVQGVKDEVHKVIEHLGNRTVGEYFANIIIPKVVEYIEQNVNIKALNELNELYIKLARDG